MHISTEKIKYNNLPVKTELYNIKHKNPHYHEDSLEIIYCLRGAVNLHNSFQHFTLNAGQMCSVDCADIHCMNSAEDNLVLICHVDLKNQFRPFDYLKHIYFACETANVFPYQMEYLKWIEKTLLALGKLQYEDNSNLNVDYCKISEQLISTFLDHFTYYDDLHYEGYANDALYERFLRILIYCHNHHREKITLAQLAKMENINANYLSQFFRRTNFQNFNTLIKYVRAYETEHLFLTTDISITEASYKCGFSDPKYFYSAFKKHWGYTPKQHRNWYRDFMNSPDDYKSITAETAIPLIEKAMTEWMIKDALV